jgi:hypothetical protein
MKKIILGLALAFSILNVYSQESMATLSGGYSFATIKDYDDPASGFRINGLYEFNPGEGKLVHGLAVGYSNISATKTVAKGDLTTTVSTIPVYYAPKLMFGSEKSKLFVKGAIGMQFASLKREGAVSLTDSDAGFYGGGGAGGMLFLTETIFVNAEYEIAFVKNNFYGDGWLNSIMGGIGIKF